MRLLNMKVRPFFDPRFQSPFFNPRFLNTPVDKTCTLNHEVPVSNAFVKIWVPWARGETLLPYCLVPRRGFKSVDPLVAYKL